VRSSIDPAVPNLLMQRYILLQVQTKWKVEDGNYFIIDYKEEHRHELVERVRGIAAAVMGEMMSNFTVRDKCGCQ